MNNIPYTYIVSNIGSAKEPAYEAYIPALNSYVFGANTKELEDGIVGSIETILASRKRKKLPIPKPDRDIKRSGKFMIRMHPRDHDRLAQEALLKNKSLNSYVVEKALA